VLQRFQFAIAEAAEAVKAAGENDQSRSRLGAEAGSRRAETTMTTGTSRPDLLESRGAGADEFRSSEVISQPNVDFYYCFAGRRQNRVQERPLDAVGEAGGPTGRNSGVALEEPIALFIVSHIVSRENGFWRNSDIPSFSALDATTIVS
jgi:hypothetical protein